MIGKKQLLKSRSVSKDIINFLWYMAFPIGMIILFNKYIITLLIAVGVTMTASKVFLICALVIANLNILMMIVGKSMRKSMRLNAPPKSLLLVLFKIESIAYLSAGCVVVLMELILSMFITASLTITPLNIFMAYCFSMLSVYGAIESYGKLVSFDFSKNDSDQIKMKVEDAVQPKSENIAKLNGTRNLGHVAESSSSVAKFNGTQNLGHVPEEEFAHKNSA
jgi:hypothetical protein